jgi:hypothetical protein
MRALPPNSDLLSLHRTCDVVGLSNGKRDNHGSQFLSFFPRCNDRDARNMAARN